MRRIVAIVALIGLGVLSTPSLSRLAAREAGVEQLVEHRVRAYFAAMGSGKVAVIEEALAEDYTVIGGDGGLETRAERVAWLRGNTTSLSAVTPSEIRVRTYGVTAVVTGLVTIPQEADLAPIEERFTQVWVQRRGAWKIVSAQITIVKK